MMEYVGMLVGCYLIYTWVSGIVWVLSFMAKSLFRSVYLPTALYVFPVIIFLIDKFTTKNSGSQENVPLRYDPKYKVEDIDFGE